MKYIQTPYNLAINEPLQSGGEERVHFVDPGNIVFRGERIATIVENPTEMNSSFYPYQNFNAGENVITNELGTEFFAACYGLVYVNQGSINVKIPIFYNKLKTKAYLFLFPKPNGTMPEIEDLRSVGVKLDIKMQRPEQELAADLNKLQGEKLLAGKKPVPVLFASAFDPEDGWNRYFILQVDPKVRSGKLREDGSIDFRERDFVFQIEKGTPILREVEPKELRDGMDIFGRILKARRIPHPEFKVGDNLAPDEKDRLLYKSTIDGRLLINPPYVSVSDQVYIPSDIDYGTGNIDFRGRIEIKGSVLAGFSIKSGNDILIHENIENGNVDCGGNLVVEGGITGDENSQVYVKGDLHTKFIQNAFIRVEGNIFVEDAIINSNIFCRGRIEVVSEKSGKIIGGRIIGKLGITANVVGSDAGNDTFLGARMDPEIFEKLIYHQKITKECKEEKTELTSYFIKSYGPAFFKNTKEFILKLPATRRKEVVERLKNLHEVNQKLKINEEKTFMYKEILSTPETVRIEIKRDLFPPTRIQIKSAQMLLEKKDSHISFSIPPEKSEIKILYS